MGMQKACSRRPGLARWLGYLASCTWRLQALWGGDVVAGEKSLRPGVQPRGLAFVRPERLRHSAAVTDSCSPFCSDGLSKASVSSHCIWATAEGIGHLSHADRSHAAHVAPGLRPYTALRPGTGA